LPSGAEIGSSLFRFSFFFSLWLVLDKKIANSVSGVGRFCRRIFQMIMLRITSS
jgi:hypothetical protein